MKVFFEFIAYIFENILFAPFNFIRKLSLVDWWMSNIISWIFIIIAIVGLCYWIFQLKIFKDEEDKDSTAHTFL